MIRSYRSMKVYQKYTLLEETQLTSQIFFKTWEERK
jgi:hypothetical protein